MFRSIVHNVDQVLCMKGPDVFLSYSSKDTDLAKRFTAALEGHGVAVWSDSGQIVVGDSISQKIQDGLETTEFLALLLTPAGVNSVWVQKEWQSKLVDEADSRSAVILPVLAKDCEIPRLLRDKHYADIRHDFETGVLEVVETIEAHRSRKRAAGKVATSSEPFSRVAPAVCSALTELDLPTRSWRRDELGWLASSDYLALGPHARTGRLPTNLAYYVESDSALRAERLILVLNINNPDTRTQGLHRLEEATYRLFQKLGYDVPEAFITSLRRASEVSVPTLFGTARVVLAPSRIETIKVVLEAANRCEGT